MTRTAASVVRDFFLAPERAAPAERAAPPAPVVVALGSARTLPALACVAGLELARAADRDHAAVCLWPPACAPAARAPAARAARRAAGRIAARGSAVDASGRLVRVRLPGTPREAAAAARRAAAAVDCPVVVGLAGARDEALDAVLAVADAVLLVRDAGSPPALVRVAEAGLARLGSPVVVCEARLGAGGRLLATTGLLAAPAARAEVAPLLAVA